MSSILKGNTMCNNPLSPKFLDANGIAEWLGVNVTTIYREIERGKLVAYKIGKAFKVKPEDLDAYLESKKVKPRQVENSDEEE